jgi:hypothetical protein
MGLGSAKAVRLAVQAGSEARDRLVRSNLGLVGKLAAAYKNACGVEFEDLYLVRMHFRFSCSFLGFLLYCVSQHILGPQRKQPPRIQVYSHAHMVTHSVLLWIPLTCSHFGELGWVERAGRWLEEV